MSAKSQSQQRLFGMVHACQKTGKCASKEVKKIAGTISYDDADELASTKHKGLPDHKESVFPSFMAWLESHKKKKGKKLHLALDIEGEPVAVTD